MYSTNNQMFDNGKSIKLHKMVDFTCKNAYPEIKSLNNSVYTCC